MRLVKKYKRYSSVPANIKDAYKNNRYKVPIPDTKEFRITRIYWSQVDYINYICMKGRMWTKTGKRIKL